MLPSTMARKAQVLAAALALGATLVALTPGETAHAAKKRWYLPEKSEPEVSVDPAARDPLNNYGKCTITKADGSIDFYLPMEMIERDGKKLMCSAEGEWFIVRFFPPGPNVVAPGTGVKTPAR